jgi:hypothetical protein
MLIMLVDPNALQGGLLCSRLTKPSCCGHCWRGQNGVSNEEDIRKAEAGEAPEAVERDSNRLPNFTVLRALMKKA